MPAIAHIGAPGWENDPRGSTALCGALLLGIVVEAGWDYAFICPACVEQRLRMLTAQDAEEQS